MVMSSGFFMGGVARSFISLVEVLLRAHVVLFLNYFFAVCLKIANNAWLGEGHSHWSLDEGALLGEAQSDES